MITTCPHTMLEHQTILLHPVPSVQQQRGKAAPGGDAGAEHSDEASGGSDLARKGPICTVPDPGEQSSTADGNQALPGVQIAREVCGDEADRSSSQKFKSMDQGQGPDQ